MNTQDPGATDRDPLQEALAELRLTARKGKSPTRHQVRDLLLALGARVRTGDTLEIENALESLRPLLPTFGESWRAVVADELALACTEHVRSVDPRYLDLPRYDFEYTTAARERLELRLLAAERLGLPATPEWMGQVARADALLAATLERRSKPAPRKT